MRRINAISFFDEKRCDRPAIERHACVDVSNTKRSRFAVHSACRIDTEKRLARAHRRFTGKTAVQRTNGRCLWCYR
jgi:hypothetical protein